MTSKLTKLTALVIALVFMAIVLSEVTPTAADAPQSGPPTVVLPTPAVTRTPPRVTPAPGAAPVRLATPTKPAVRSPRSPSGFGTLSLSSSIQVQNLSTTTQATIGLTYYNQSDGSQLGIVNDTIPAGASVNYYPILNGSPNGPNVSSFNGSVVVSSDQPVTAIANLQNPPTYSFTTSSGSFSQGSTTFGIPLIMCNNSGFNTMMNVQNAGSATANVNITYTPGSNGVSHTESATIQPGAAKSFDQTIGSTTVNCSTLADGSGKFIGSAKVTSDQPVVATVLEMNSTTFPVLLQYNGFASGDQTVYLPLIMANNSSFYTTVQVQNMGTGTCASITMTYGPNTGGSFSPTSESFSLTAGASKTIFQSASPPANGSSNNWATAGKYIGAATISAPGCSIAAIVNELTSNYGGSAYAEAYGGFLASAATSNVSAPLIMSNNSGYFTTLQVQNVGGASSCPITVNYGADTATSDGAYSPTSETFNLDVGASKTIFQAASPPGNGSTNNWASAGRYIGSARVTAVGCNIVALVNEQNYSSASGDRLLTYTGFNY